MKFIVEVIDRKKQKKEIEVNAEDRKSAISSIRSQGYLIIGMIEKTDDTGVLDLPTDLEHTEKFLEEITISKKPTDEAMYRNTRDKKQKGFRTELTAKGHNGQIELYNSKVCIRRQGMLGFLTQGLKGDKNITISSISSIQFKKAGMLTNGYIQFSFIGGQEAKGGVFQATKDENTVMFTVKQQPLFEEIKNIIERKVMVDGCSESIISDADELIKLASLVDKGILTEEEFQYKKKHILGL